jgi:ubiquinone/menaquinone biosynthesis C-methylase UbiE
MGMKNIEWLEGDEEEIDYHLKQYEEPKSYTKYLINHIKEKKLISNGDFIIDLGCGCGANSFFFSKCFKHCNFLGIDINPRYIKIANKYKLGNLKYKVGNLFDIKLKKKIKGILSIQTLSWLNDYKKALSSMFELKPEWILITSLFYDGPVTAKIIINDFSRTMGKLKYRKTYYNIYSIDELKKYSQKYNYNLFEFKPFELSLDLTSPSNKSMGTYTEKLENGKRIQISGPILMNWYTLILKKQI